MQYNYKEWFVGYNNCVIESHEERFNLYFRNPDTITEEKYVSYYDDIAKETIERAENLIKNLTQYRQDLAKRFSDLACMSYHYVASLKRYKSYITKSVTYTLELIRVYSDGHEESEESTVYPGIERHKAIKAFNEMKKQRPGIETRFDIEKSRWER